MSDSKPDIKFDVIGKFRAVFCQPNIAITILCIFFLVVLYFLGSTVIKIDKIFSLFFIALIICVMLILFVFLAIKNDTTESIEISDGSKKMIFKSPSRQIIPFIMTRLLDNTARPNKLIPKGTDLKDDPSKFEPLTEEQQEEIVKKEVEIAVLGKSDKETS